MRALNARAARLDAELESIGFTRRTIRDGATGANGAIPEHVREVLDFRSAHLRAEGDWTRRLQQRLESGTYVFAGEGGFRASTTGSGNRPSDSQG